MNRNYYYLVNSLISIDFDQYDTVPIADIFDKIEINLSSRDRHYLYYQKLQVDLINLEMTTAGYDQFLPFGTYSKEVLLQKEEKGGIPQLWQDYLSNYNAGNAIPIEYLWFDYFDLGIKENNSFIRAWAQNELALKIALVIARKERTDTDTSYMDTIQGSLIEEILSGSKMIDFGIGYRFDWATQLREILKEENPLYSERSIDHIRWQFIDQQISSYQFRSEVVLGYIQKLIIIAKWQQFNLEEGKRMLRGIVGGE